MANDDEQSAPAVTVRDELRNEIATRKAEREAAMKRAELLHLAGQIAGGMMASPLGAQAPMGSIAEAAVKIAELVRATVDQALSPVVLPGIAGLPQFKVPQ